MKIRVSIHVLPWVLLLGVIAGFVMYRAVDAQSPTEDRYNLECKSFSLDGIISFDDADPIGFSNDFYASITSNLVWDYSGLTLSYADTLTMNCSLVQGTVVP